MVRADWPLVSFRTNTAAHLPTANIKLEPTSYFPPLNRAYELRKADYTDIKVPTTAFLKGFWLAALKGTALRLG